METLRNTADGSLELETAAGRVNVAVHVESQKTSSSRDDSLGLVIRNPSPSASPSHTPAGIFREGLICL